MEDTQFEPLQQIPFGDCGIQADHFYMQKMMVLDTDYRVLFMPLSADLNDSKWRLEPELGTLNGNIFEVKFVLGMDFESEGAYQFASPKELGLKPLHRRGLTTLGESLVEGIVRFSSQVPVDGLVALALDEKPKLNLYYSRVLSTHAASLRLAGFEAKSCLGGQGYALFRTGYAIDRHRTASAQA